MVRRGLRTEEMFKVMLPVRVRSHKWMCSYATHQQLHMLCNGRKKKKSRENWKACHGVASWIYVKLSFHMREQRTDGAFGRLCLFDCEVRASCGGSATLCGNGPGRGACQEA